MSAGYNPVIKSAPLFAAARCISGILSLVTDRALTYDRLPSGNGQAPGIEIGRCTVAVPVGAADSTTGGCSTFGAGWLFWMGAVFFAAIVFAGFLAALRAAGFLPAAFFFAALLTFAARLAFAATLTAFRADDEDFAARPVRRTTFLAAFFTAFFATDRLAAPFFAADFFTFLAGRFVAFFADDFDFAAIAHLRG